MKAIVPSKLFAPIDRPGYTDALKFPDDITKIHTQEVGRLLGRYTALQCYALSCLSRTSQELLRVESETRLTRTHLISRMGSVKEKWRQDQLIDLNEAIQKLAVSETKLRVEKEHQASFVQIFDRYVSALSRELSRRSSEMAKPM